MRQRGKTSGQEEQTEYVRLLRGSLRTRSWLENISVQSRRLHISFSVDNKIMTFRRAPGSFSGLLSKSANPSNNIKLSRQKPPASLLSHVSILAPGIRCALRRTFLDPHPELWLTSRRTAHIRPLKWIHFDKCVLGAIVILHFARTVFVFDTAVIRSRLICGIHLRSEESVWIEGETHNFR